MAENDPERTEWHLKCYPGGKRSEYSEYIGLYLHSETRDIDFYYGDVEFSIIDGEGQKRFCYEYKDYNIAGTCLLESAISESSWAETHSRNGTNMIYGFSDAYR